MGGRGCCPLLEFCVSCSELTLVPFQVGRGLCPVDTTSSLFMRTSKFIVRQIYNDLTSSAIERYLGEFGCRLRFRRLDVGSDIENYCLLLRLSFLFIEWVWQLDSTCGCSQSSDGLGENSDMVSHA